MMRRRQRGFWNGSARVQHGCLKPMIAGKTYETLKSRGVRFLSPPEERQYGLEAIFEDLYGNVFSLLKPSTG